MKKGQAAINYFFTYGVVLLILVVASAALFNLGVMKKATFSGKGCTGLDKFHYVDHTLRDDGTLTLDILNLRGQDVIVKKITAMMTNGMEAELSDEINFLNNERNMFTIEGFYNLAPNKDYEFDLKIEYDTDELKGMSESGHCYGVIESSGTGQVGGYSWEFDSPSSYDYNSSEIELGPAKLVSVEETRKDDDSNDFSGSYSDTMWNGSHVTPGILYLHEGFEERNNSEILTANFFSTTQDQGVAEISSLQAKSGSKSLRVLPSAPNAWKTLAITPFVPTVDTKLKASFYTVDEGEITGVGLGSSGSIGDFASHAHTGTQVWTDSRQNNSQWNSPPTLNTWITKTWDFGKWWQDSQGAFITLDSLDILHDDDSNSSEGYFDEIFVYDDTVSSGVYTSDVIDAGNSVSWDAISWEGLLGESSEEIKYDDISEPLVYYSLNTYSVRNWFDVTGKDFSSIEVAAVLDCDGSCSGPVNVRIGNASSWQDYELIDSSSIRTDGTTSDFTWYNKSFDINKAKLGDSFFVQLMIYSGSGTVRFMMDDAGPSGPDPEYRSGSNGDGSQTGWSNDNGDYMIRTWLTTSGGDVSFKVRSDDDNSGWGDWLGPDGTTSSSYTTPTGEALNVNNNRYFQYRVTFDSSETALDSVTLNYSAYVSTTPSISPTTAFTPESVSSWSGFIESAEKNNGEIYYQLWDGSDWLYYNGGWITAGANDYNTALIINENINSFPTTSGEINFKAFLSSNGFEQVELEKVTITYQE